MWPPQWLWFYLMPYYIGALPGLGSCGLRGSRWEPSARSAVGNQHPLEKERKDYYFLGLNASLQTK